MQNKEDGTLYPINSIAFDSGEMLAGGTDPSNIKLWNKASGDLVKVLIGHRASVLSVAFGGRKQLASGSADKSIKLWDSGTGDLLR